MILNLPRFRQLLTAALLIAHTAVSADQIHLAAASNFTHAIKALAEQYEKQSGHDVVISFGSTGKLYAQITHGAPYDIFLAADKARPELLETNGMTQPGSRFTYAVGKLVLWSPDNNLVDPEGHILLQDAFRHLAIANPGLAPYGKAARQVMQHKGVWDKLKSRLVRGENIGQAYQFVKSGNASLGFVAFSQLQQYPTLAATGSWWDIPQSLYDPIEQQAVLLKDNAAARDFLNFIKSSQSQAIIRRYGYGTL